MTVLEVDRGVLIRHFHGENVIAGLTEVARGRGITAAWVNGLGALLRAELGYYDLGARAYQRLAVEEETELASLVGNVSLVDGHPFYHLHATLAKKDFSAIGGHLFEATAGATVEIALFPFSGIRLERKPDQAIGLNLWDLPPWAHAQR